MEPAIEGIRGMAKTDKPHRSLIGYVLIGLLSLAIVVSIVNIILTLQVAASLGIDLGTLLGQ